MVECVPRLAGRHLRKSGATNMMLIQVFLSFYSIVSQSLISKFLQMFLVIQDVIHHCANLSNLDDTLVVGAATLSSVSAGSVFQTSIPMVLPGNGPNRAPFW